MKTALHEQYSTALREYCEKGEEATLAWAFQPYLLGHRAAREGFGALEMAAMHQKALVETLVEMLEVDDTTRIAHRASEFVAEALAPFEQGRRPSQEGSSTPCESQQEREQLKAAQHKLKGAMDLLLEQMRAEQRKNELICVLSHEIHGSLGVLMSELGVEMNDHRQRLLDVALRNSERLIRLVGDSPDEIIETGPRTFDETRPEAGSGPASS